MKPLHKPAGIFLLVLILLSLPALACTLSPLYKSPDEYTPDEWNATQAAIGSTLEAQVQVTKEAETEAEIEVESEAENQPAMDNPDDKIVFAYTGENQSYHTGLRNRTVFYIDYDTEKVLASESASFEEPAGCNTAIGTDSVNFEGTITDGVEILGDLTITTDFTASGCEDSNRSSTVKYMLTGVLWAEFVDGQWSGTVTGAATLKQTWSDGEGPDVDDTYSIEWTIVGTPIE